MRSAISVHLKKTSSVIVLMLMPWAAIFAMAKSSSAERTTLDSRLLVNTWVLRQMRLWCIDLQKPIVLSQIFYNGRHFTSKGAQTLKQFNDGFEPPLSIRRFLGKRKEAQNAEGSEPASHPVPANSLTKTHYSRHRHAAFLAGDHLTHVFSCCVQCTPLVATPFMHRPRLCKYKNWERFAS